MSIELFLPVLFLGSLMVLARVLQGSWIAPGPFYILYIFSLVLVTVALQYYSLWSGAIWWILISVLVYFLGTIMGDALPGPAKSSRFPRNADIKFPKIEILIPIGTALGVFHVIFLFLFTGSVREFREPPLLIQFFDPFENVPPILAGMYFASCRSKNRWILSGMSLFPRTLGSIMFSGRSGIVVVLTLWLAGFFVIRTLMEGRNFRLFTWPRIISGLLLMITVAWTAIIITMSRYTSELGMRKDLSSVASSYLELIFMEDWGPTWERFRFAFTGGYAAFSVWFEDIWRYPPETATWGAYLFAGPLHIFGLRSRTDTPMEPLEIEPGVWTNVYSPFRPMIDDFTLWGSLVVFFAVGVVMGWGYRRLVAGGFMALPVMVMFYTDAMNGGFAFRYNTIIITYILIAGYTYWWRNTLYQRERNNVTEANGIESDKNMMKGKVSRVIPVALGAEGSQAKNR